MTRAVTHTGFEGSGQVQVPPTHAHAFDTAERLVSNPLLKLLGGAVVGLCSILIIVLLWSGNLKLSTIEAHLTTLDVANAELRRDVRELREWRAAQGTRDDFWESYREGVENQNRQGQEFLELIREIRDRLPQARK